MLSNPAPRLQLAFITGQSDPRSCALSPLQAAFGQALLLPGRVLRPQNFPYRADTPAHQPVPLWKASWHNSVQYLKSRRASFVRAHQASVLTMLDAAPHTLLLAGSCGLELLTNLHLPHHMLQRISVLAYGPVARRNPACANLVTVAGHGDWISRMGYGQAARTLRCGHINYLEQAELVALAQRFVAEVEARLV